MIQDMLHPLDEVEAFGCTEHGLIRFDSVLRERRFVDGVPWAYPRLIFDAGVLQLVRKPGIAPVPLSELALASERALGRVWQNYNLLQRDWSLFGQSIGGWIYWASNGTPWVIRPTNLPQPRAGQAYSVTLSCQPFGYLDEAPAPPLELVLPLADIQQTGTAFRQASFETINSTGSTAMLRMQPVGGGLVTGYLRISIGEADDALTGSLSVHKSQAAVRGEWAQDYTLPLSFERRQVYAVGSISPDTGEAKFPEGGGSAVLTISGALHTEPGSNSPNAALFSSGALSAGRTGRVLAVVFDDADVLIEYSYNTRYAMTYSYPLFELTATGSSSGSATYDADFVDVQWSTQVDAEMQRTVSERVVVEVELLRNGAAVAVASVEESRSANQTRTVSIASGAGFNPYPAQLAGLSGWTLAVGSGPVFLNPGQAAGPPTGSAAVDGAFPDSWDTGQPSFSVPGIARLNLQQKMPNAPADADSLTAELLFRVTGEAADRRVRFFANSAVSGGASLSRQQPRPAPETGNGQYELALVYPHAAQFGRGEGASLFSVAYHPLTHELVTDDTGGLPVTFV
ncbi:MAG: hypothetical protein KJ884_15935 [Gammaproteobacteria bacterium]|uniref:Uncharacterized protein n=1 Tax=viral metagenome TaxID=1070528 RepID=A0A6M3J814_9ZZZZ|nr:hypothetical protein [Gammaproteobacteria bacterium]MBU1492217.1 hypothetical protein [Gammaproteobacteria bacterium]MBU2066788.1 hypothetical protein [Gammaproteobacteria bacterium]MBU2137396.1 hypothetical protein [Gammaproteobacteria bacterium]MBU2215043.1 hypothetical protein [Gammaproteobacteria bacterium]